MSSLKDIMDVDVEPLDAQALRRSREAAAQQGQQPGQHSSSPTYPQSLDTTTGQPPLKRRRSNRAQKSSSQLSSSRPNLAHRRSSETTESMESYGGPHGGNAQPPSTGGSSRVSSRGSNPPDGQVRYTPVTGRVSRAKKGQPVHVCDQCEPPRVFTRAEHLRRHALGHQKPAYPCTFEDCEKAFHRPDLLARHLNRHETQGEKAYKAGDSTRSRSSSTSSSTTPPLKVETPMRVDTSVASPTSTAQSSTPHTSASTESAKTAVAFDSIVPGFQAVNFSGTANEHNAGQFDDSNQSSSHAGLSSEPNVSSNALGNNAGNFPSTPIQGMPREIAFTEMNQMFRTQDSMFSGANHSLPILTLQVPEAQCPGLSYSNSNNSPWYSSSDSTWSTPSEASRFNGSAWPRDRSNSTATIADWSNHQQMPWSPGGNTVQTPRSAILETVPENFESPPYLSPQFSPPMVSYPLSASISSPTGGYNMELVGTPTLSSPFRPLAQSLPAPTTRIFRSKFTERDFGDTTMVDGQYLNRSVSEGSTPEVTKIDDYLTSYRTHLEPIYSIIHPESFDNHLSDVAKNAMAALGSQFHKQTFDREHGSFLHENCMQTLILSSEWDFQTMQAIFLTEIFARFRAKKADVRLSYQFVRLYKKLVNDSFDDSVNPFVRLNSKTISYLVDTELEKQQQTGIPGDRQQIIESTWRSWIDYEVRQRIRTACFAFDVHQSMCFEQSRCETHANAETLYIPYPCAQILWNARSSQEWYELVNLADYPVSRLTHPENMSAKEIYELPLSTQCVSLLSMVALLPSKIQKPRSSIINDPLTTSIQNSIHTSFPHFMTAQSYLALYHTPVRKLLGLTGKSWVLNHKLTDHSEIDALVPAIRAWSSTACAAQATWHACQVLRILLSSPLALQTSSQWWSSYTSALIIWAFGHRGNTSPASSSESSWGSSITLRGVDEADAVNTAALTYLDGMLELQPLKLSTAPMRGDTNAVLDAIRLKLVKDADMGRGHGCSALLLDAIGVLERLRSGGKWF